MHTVINVDETVPQMVWVTDAATSDHKLPTKHRPDKDTIYVFDKGDNDYKAFEWFTEKEVGFVTRIKDKASYTTKEQLYVDECIHSGVLEDVIIEIEVTQNGIKSKLKLRKVWFYEKLLKREFKFLTNLF